MWTCGRVPHSLPVPSAFCDIILLAVEHLNLLVQSRSSVAGDVGLLTVFPHELLGAHSLSFEGGVDLPLSNGPQSLQRTKTVSSFQRLLQIEVLFSSLCTPPPDSSLKGQETLHLLSRTNL